jgi:hypothetical protein
MPPSSPVLPVKQHVVLAVALAAFCSEQSISHDLHARDCYGLELHRCPCRRLYISEMGKDTNRSLGALIGR